MFADKTLCSKYFSFFSFRSFGYAKKKTLRLAAQAFAFNYKPTCSNNFCVQMDHGAKKKIKTLVLKVLIAFFAEAFVNH